jgi:uncharacterized repeat protein (TIGR01451 family)
MNSKRYRCQMTVLITIAVLAGGLALIPLRGSSANSQVQTAPAQDAFRVKYTAARQIQALLQEKESRTPVQQRIDSHLLQALKMSRNEPVAEGIEKLETGIATDADGMSLVDIKATVTRRLLGMMRRMGAEIINSFDNDIRARVPLAQLETLASFPGVKFIRPADLGMTSRAAGPDRSAVSINDLERGRGGLSAANAGVRAQASGLQADLAPGFEARAATVRSGLAGALLKRSGFKPMMFHVDSQGDVAHQADLARSTYGINGSGVKIGVMSDGVDALAALQGAGDLPNVTVLMGQAGSGNEGSAMLEIVFDLAPGAQLFFATAGGGSASFAQNIRDLRSAGCDIIVDDFSYFAESPFQDGQTMSVMSDTNGGVIAQAVNDVTAGGALYFSSAANDGNLDDGSGTWEGDFVDGGALGGLSGGTVNDFGSGNLGDAFTGVGGNDADLYWSDPLGGSNNDYDFFLLDSTLSTVLSSSTNTQSGSQDPFEFIPGKDAMKNPIIQMGTRLVIFKHTGANNRFLHIATNRSQLSVATSGATKGHPCSAAAYGVAAVNVADAMGGAFTGGSADPVETFSSDGLRHLFFNADSTPITPGNFSSTGGLVRQKPDIAAADGVSTDAPKFGSFFGTSAAAPHAAAIAGLLKSYKPSLTPAQIRTFLTSTALDIQEPGVDRDSGSGIVMAFAALTAASSSDLSVTMNASPPTVVANSNITYKITLHNGGPDTAVNITLNDSLPAGTAFVSCNSNGGGVCGGSGNNRSISFASLASGASANITIIATAQCSDADGTVLNDMVTVGSLTPDPNSGNNTASAPVTVSNPAPQIACPANIVVGTPNRGASGMVVTFPAPVVTSPCLVSLIVNPPSGSVFPPGVTTVTAQATDTLGRMVSCSFTVTVYNVCLHNAATGAILEFSTTTGDYKFIDCASGFTLVGKGTVSVVNSVVVLTDNQSDRRVNAKFLEGQLTGQAVVTSIAGPGLTHIYQINDLSTVNSCSCH